MSPDTEALTVLEAMEQHGIAQIPVVQGRQFLGLVTRDRILAFIRTRSKAKQLE